jgi:hypothetical protein
MQKSLARVSSRIIFAFLALAASISLPRASAQITSAPPAYWNNTLPYPNLYLNAPSHWQYMVNPQPGVTPQGPLTTVPSVPLTRVVGNVHWGDAQPGKSSSTWRTDLGSSMGMTTSATSTTPSTACTQNGSEGFQWWPTASCYPSSGNTTAQPNNILFTFYTVPTWASVAGGTYTDSTGSVVGWTINSISANCHGSGTCTMVLNTSSPYVSNMVKGSVIVLSGNSNNATLTLASASDNATTHQTTVTFSAPASGAAINTSGHVTYTNAEPPSDVLSTSACPTMPDGNAAVGNGDCYFKVYVTWIMMHTCNSFSAPYTLHTNTCVIHYFEGWNEFNNDGFWTGNYTQLAKMMTDAATIIKTYCTDCFFIAGSTTAGGAGYHARPDTPKPSGCSVSSLPCDTRPDSSQIYLEALGQLLRDWHTALPATPPDMISVHPYPGFDNIYMPAMPETNVVASYDPTSTNSPYYSTSNNICTGSKQAHAQYGIAGATVNSGGSRYAINDILTIVQSGASGGKVQVTSISGGTITGVALVSTDPGSNYTVANGLAVTGGSGSGATMDVTSVGLGDLLYDSNGNAVLVGTSGSGGSVAGCMNICGKTYTGGSSTVINELGVGSNSSFPNSALACNAYIANPPSGDANFISRSPIGTAWPGCSVQNTSMSIYATTDDYYEPDNTTGHIRNACIDSFVNVFRAARQMLADIQTDIDTVTGTSDIPSGWLSSSLPIWNTESSWGPFSESNFAGQKPKSAAIDPKDSSLTTFYQQAYIARLAILGSEVGPAVNLWYQWDESSTTQDWDLQVVQSFGNWGQFANSFMDTSGTLTATATRPSYTFNRVYQWLAGATLSGIANPGTTWNQNTAFTQNTSYYDGSSLQRVAIGGTSGSTTPQWNKALYGLTQDGGVVWENMGDLKCNDTSTFSGTVSPATTNPNVWQCPITKASPSGYQGVLAWYSPFDSTKVFPTPAGMTCLKDIDGNLIATTPGYGHSIFNRPALFDNISSCSGTDGFPK